MYYRSKPSITRISVVTEKPFPFPALTLCNMNSIRASFAGQSAAMEEAVHTLSGHTPDLSDPRLVSLLTNTSALDLVLQGSMVFEAMFRQCVWDSTVVDCGDYFTRTLTSLGLCYTFNAQAFIRSQGQLHVSRTGVKHGLSLLLNVQQDEYLHSQLAAGFKVTLTLYAIL